MNEGFYTAEHEDFRGVAKEYVARSLTPFYEEWERDHLSDRAAWTAAGDAGLLGLAVPEEYGGLGESDYRYRMVLGEEFAEAAVTSFATGFGIQDDIVLPYLLDLATDEQRQRWLPGLVSGEIISAIAMTEPGAGSDVRGIRTAATRNGSDWVLNGQKTFITNGILADLILVAARTGGTPERPAFTLFVVERGTRGFERGRKLDKVGNHAQDTAELFFENVRLPSENVVGEVDRGFAYLMERLPKERFSIAQGALAGAQAAYGWACSYVFERKAFGQPIGDFQNTRFVLAEMETALDVTRAYVQRAALALNNGTLSTADASKAKWWTTELQLRVVSKTVQLFGGYGYMNEYPIARAFRDTRIQTIYGGTTEIMKEIIGRDIAGRHR